MYIDKPPKYCGFELKIVSTQASQLQRKESCVNRENLPQEKQSASLGLSLWTPLQLLSSSLVYRLFNCLLYAIKITLDCFNCPTHCIKLSLE